jgi:hypothetical protein
MSGSSAMVIRLVARKNISNIANKLGHGKVLNSRGKFGNPDTTHKDLLKIPI